MILDNFININIVKQPMPVQTKYDTAVFVTNAISSGYYTKGGTGNGTTKADAKNIDDVNNAYVKCFADNGGKFLHVVSKTTKASALPLNEIVLFTDTTSGALTDSWTNADKEGIYQKLYLKPISTTTAQGTGTGTAYKYVPDGAASSTSAPAVAAIAAYYTKLDITAGIKDYAFTAEIVPDSAVITNDTTIKTILDNHLNADINLANAVRNVGGDDSTGDESMTNFVMRVVLQQEITAALLNLLCSKINYDINGITSVKAVISEQLLKFVNNGYIATNKVWTDEDLYLDNEFIIGKNTVLTSGYAIHIAPITPDDIKNHRFPNIYILYADAVSIRKIVINGNVY